MKLCKQISRARGCNPGYKTKHVDPHAGAALKRGQGRTPEQEKEKPGSMGVAPHPTPHPASGRQT